MVDQEPPLEKRNKDQQKQSALAGCFLSVEGDRIENNSLYTNFEKGITVTQEIFDLGRYTRTQLQEALTCPLNRDMTRREHECDDWELFRHPEWLMRHYLENGGAIAFASRRADFVRQVEVPEEDYMI